MCLLLVNCLSLLLFSLFVSEFSCTLFIFCSLALLLFYASHSLHKFKIFHIINVWHAEHFCLSSCTSLILSLLFLITLTINCLLLCICRKSYPWLIIKILHRFSVLDVFILIVFWPSLLFSFLLFSCTSLLLLHSSIFKAFNRFFWLFLVSMNYLSLNNSM